MKRLLGAPAAAASSHFLQDSSQRPHASKHSASCRRGRRSSRRCVGMPILRIAYHGLCCHLQAFLMVLRVNKGVGQVVHGVSVVRRHVKRRMRLRVAGTRPAMANPRIPVAVRVVVAIAESLVGDWVAVATAAAERLAADWAAVATAERPIVD